ncbi:hypothetical protein JK359_35755 [Streptomyces actinomycinicus]|uniref:Uncharacterized protein n=1 Tax=Streptomyces actinomycinicus TaxID=1695166 RepID=A0A937EPQ3_9ACTN|nr:hypothetical protein [Streptomyces actinomycinicus]MBL1087262.1 hypothetical protein [Streptomyces actinomycinicus]
MNADANHENPSRDLSTWTIERLQSFAEDAQGQQLEAVRVVAQGHAYFADEPREARKQWAKLSLQANQRLHGDSLWDRARAAQQNFLLRMWVIDQFGPDDEDHDWSPERLAADTVTALALTPSEARALADHWRELAVEQIGELRRHKNLTAHLDRLVDHLQPSPIRDQLLAWIETRQHLP